MPVRAYLDHNATTPPLPEVAAAVAAVLTPEGFGNPSSLHQVGQRAREALELARGRVARLLGAQPREVVFTGSGTEADDLALLGLLAPGDHLVTTAVEHHAVLATCRRLEARGVAVSLVPVDGEGRVNPAAVKAALRPATRLLSVMLANNETGVLQPVEAVGRVAAEAGVRLHTDAVQAAGKVPLSVERLGCHLLSLSAHKLNGPQGVGALYVRRGTRLQPQLLGGGQERRLRAGTENLPGIVGFGVAAEAAAAWLAAGGAAGVAALRDRLEQGLLAAVPGVRLNGGGARVPNTTNLSFRGIAGSALVVALDQEGLCASTGAACGSASREPPHVLRAMGLAVEEAQAAVRFSLGKQTTPAEVAWALEVVPAVVARLRALSPRWKEPPPA